MYQCSVLEEAGRYQEGINHLQKYEKDIVDKLYMEETRASLYQSLEDSASSAAIYRSRWLCTFPPSTGIALLCGLFLVHLWFSAVIQ